MAEEFPSDNGGPSFRSELSLEELTERKQIFDELEKLKSDNNAKVRLPNKSLPIEKLRDRAEEVKIKILGKNDAEAVDVPKPPPKAKAKPKPKPQKRSLEPKKTVPQLDYSSDEDDEPELYRHKQKPMFHAMFYSGVSAIGGAAALSGFEEFAPMGQLVKSNDVVYDPIIDELAREYGFSGGMPLPPELRLAACLGSTMAHCYCAAHPELPAVARAVPETLGSFFSLNLAINHAVKSSPPGGRKGRSAPA